MEKVLNSTNTLIENYLKVRKQTEKLVAPLEVEDFVCQPVLEVSPPKWHLAHSSWFFENFILAKHLPGYRLFDENFNYLFNSYYNSQGKRILRNNRGSLSRPSTKVIFDYRKQVDQGMQKLLSEEELITDELLLFLKIGINHEQQHQELLLTDIKYILGNNPLLPVYRAADEIQAAEPIDFDWLEVSQGLYQIGYSGSDFHFDNEEKRHQVYLQHFFAANRLVTNQEYLEFMETGGYQKAEYWLADGWDWVQENKVQAPLYWFEKNGSYFSFQLDGVRKILPYEPVMHISFYEAEAYARWKNCRLLTEQEWEVCANLHGNSSEHSQFQESEILHPKVAEDHQFFGTLWEWTESAYLPYPGYQQAKGALGEYNGKFMVNQKVLRGGSFASPENHIRSTYRNFFQPDLRWQFCGIRLAKNNN